MNQRSLPFDPARPQGASPLHAARRSVIALGSGRSGTSMLAGTLARSGWYVGEDPYPGRDSNPKGFFETREINGLNEYLLAGAQAPETRLVDWQRWLARVPLGTDFEFPPDLAARVRALAARRPFAFKDPRLCYTLGAWTPHLGDFARLCIFREPQRTAHSMVKECATQDYLRGTDIDTEAALAIWSSMYRHVLEKHARTGDWLFLHYDQLLAPEGLDRLESFLGAPVARDFPEAGLKRSPGSGDVPAAAAQIYAHLCDLAGHAAPRRSVHAVAAPTPAADPELSVILCSYNRRAILRECLDALQSQTAAGRFEVVVVDDGSDDGTREMLDAYRFAVPHRVVHRANGGLAAARNTALAAARGRLLLFINDDTIAWPDLVERHLERHAALGPGLHSVLGSFEQPREALANSLTRLLEITPYVFCYPLMEAGRTYGWNRWWTCNVSVPARAVHEAGGFDESFRQYGCEDSDLAIRLERLGADVVYDPGARALHRHVLGLDDLARRQHAVARAHVRLFAKHPGALNHPDWAWVSGLERAALERELAERLPERGRLEASARELARIDLDRLDGTGDIGDSVQAGLLGRLAGLLSTLNDLWWRAGFAQGLAEHGLESFAQMRPAPWPLSTTATHRLLAWPRYDSDAELDRLIGEFGAQLAGHAGACLCLRHDGRADVPLDDAVARLTRAWERNLADADSLEVLLITEELHEAELARLGAAVSGVLQLEQQPGDARARFLRRLGAHPVRSGADLAALLARAVQPDGVSAAS